MQLLTHTASPTTAGRVARPSQAGPIPTAAEDEVLARWQFHRISEYERSSAESFIAAQFMKAYGACITEFMPDLMGLYDGQTIAAACGLRAAATGPMFLEQYLDQPADTAIEKMTGLQTGRCRMIEVGNLSISRPGYARHLVYWLTMHLRSIGMRWAVFSAVPALRNNFQRLGIPLITLGPASADKLSAEARASWGTYYDQQPQVTAVSVDTAFRVLGENPCNP